MTDFGDLKVLFVAGFGPVVTDSEASQALYVRDLGLPLTSRPEESDYFHGTLSGVRHFALWPIKSAAQSCFGADRWPDHVPVPQAWLEFDVEDVRAASAVLTARGYTLLVDTRTEPWGQTVTRLLSPEGLLVGLTFTPWLR